MNYDQPILETYGAELGEFTWTGGFTLNVRGPKGKTGYVVDIVADTTTSIVGTSSVPEIAIGLSSADASYGRFRLGSTASNGYGVGVKRASALVPGQGGTGLDPLANSDFSGHVSLRTARIPADTDFTIAGVAASGSAAGKSRVRVTIAWG